ncbi:MAG: hypothetical protein IJU98_03150, partial [Synergistaceae bacterium]|nr:hypothetical protein [Synergistaceae bacterium]
MRIYHNIPALTAYNALNNTSNQLQKTIQKLSTGLRINSASDDAAGLAISEKMRAQISGLNMAQRNAQDGISMLQTAEGAISSTQSILQRMRELAVQASNDTLTAEDRSYIQLEVDELRDEVDRIANTTQFNGKRLLDGSSAGVTSTSNLGVNAYVRGSLREIDQFGQKKAIEGNFKIQIKAAPGQGEVQKSSIMVIKHPNVITDVQVNEKDGINSVRVDNVPAGDYKVKAAVAAEAGVRVVGSYGFNQEAQAANLYIGGAVTSAAASAAFTMTYTPASGTGITLNYTAPGTGLATIDDIKAALQEQIDANVDLKGKVTVGTATDGTDEFLTFSAVGGTLDFTGTDADFGVDNTTTAKFANVTGYSETLTGGNITKELENATTIKITLTDSDGNVIKDAAGTELKDVAIEISAGGGDDTSRTRAAAINDVLATSDLAGIITADVDDLGNVTLKSVVGHIDLSSTEPADISAVLGTPTTDSMRNQPVEELISAKANTANNASILFEVSSVSNDTVTLKATANVMTTDGTVKNYVKDNIILNIGDSTNNIVELGELLGEDEGNFTLALNKSVNPAESFKTGNKFVYNVVGAGSGDTTANMSVTVDANQDLDWPERWDQNGDGKTSKAPADPASERLTYNLNASAASKKELHFRNFFVNSDNGSVYEGDVVLTTNEDFTLGGELFVPTTVETKFIVDSPAGTEKITVKVDNTQVGTDIEVEAGDTAITLAAKVKALIETEKTNGNLEHVSVSVDGSGGITITSSRGKAIEIKSDTVAKVALGAAGTDTADIDESDPNTTEPGGNIVTGDTLASFTAAYIGKTATRDTQLRDLK